jgi:transposase-like protein
VPAELVAGRRGRGRQPARAAASESAELRDLRRRNRLLEQEVEVLRRATAYLSQAHLPGK